MLLAKRRSGAVCLVCALLLTTFGHGATNDYDDENRPYEFSFNIVDFQHRFEKKDKEGIVTGEYGFITADGVYHETGYATNKDGDFIITKQRNRKITSLKDARDIFKDQPEAAEKLFEAVAKSCSGCKIPVKQDKDNKQRNTIVKTTKTNSDTSRQNKIASIMKEMIKVLANKMNIITPTVKEGTVPRSKEVPSANDISRGPEKETRQKIVKEMIETAKKMVIDPRSTGKIESRVLEEIPDEIALEKMANDLYYRFNYTITTHGHHEDGYRDGRKDGSYRSQSENGVDMRVEYLSNEFGHQPNITFSNSTSNKEQKLNGYSFLWFWK